MSNDKKMLENRFHSTFVERLAVIERETHYKPKFLLDCVEKGEEGHSIAARLFENAKLEGQAGFLVLAGDKCRPDLTIEALVIDNQEWQKLFTEKQLNRAGRRLIGVGYSIKHC